MWDENGRAVKNFSFDTCFFDGKWENEREKGEFFMKHIFLQTLINCPKKGVHFIEQQYDIVRFTYDTLILAPIGRDIFKLNKPNKENQYVFVNSLNGFTFVKLHFKTSIVVPESNYYLSINLTIDSTKKSFVKLHDDYMNETNVVTTSMSKYEYKTLITILAGLNIGGLPENFVPSIPSLLISSNLFRLNDYLVLTDHAAVECCNSFFEIQYNDQIKTCKGCTFVPFYHPALECFLVDYIAMKSFQSGRRPILW